MLLRFLPQSLKRVKGEFLYAAAVEVRNIRSLCDVGQNQQRGFGRGQIRGSTAQRVSTGPSRQTVIHLRLLMTLLNRTMCLLFCWMYSEEHKEIKMFVIRLWSDRSWALCTLRETT